MTSISNPKDNSNNNRRQNTSGLPPRSGDVDVGKGHLSLSDFGEDQEYVDNTDDEIPNGGGNIGSARNSGDTGHGIRRSNDTGSHHSSSKTPDAVVNNFNEKSNVGDEDYNDNEEDDGDDAGDDSDDESEDDDDMSGELNAVYLKRNADFHMLFRELPINELLIDDYGCALQRDILVQGRLYLTDNHVCFYSNIFGWVTNLIIALDEIVTIEKRMTALIIPNAIEISTLHAKHFFGSFIYRDSAYGQLTDLWRKARLVTSKGEEMNGIEGDIMTHGIEDESDEVSSHDRYNNTSGENDSSNSQWNGDNKSNSQNIIEDEDNDLVSSSGTESDVESDGGKGTSSSPLNDVVNGNLSASDLTTGMKRHSWKDVGNGLRAGKTVSRRSSINSNPVMGIDAGSTGDLTAVPPTPRSTAQLSVRKASSITPLATNFLVNGTADDKAGKGSNTTATRGGGKGSSAKSKKKGPSTTEPSTSPKPVALHPPTRCPCDIQESSHYDNVALDEIFPISLPVLFRLVFGEVIIPNDIEEKYGVADPDIKKELSTWQRDLLTGQGMRELKITPWSIPSEANESESQQYNYIRPLNFSIGPKQTNVTQGFTITTKDLERSVVVEETVRTPDVPSGSSFFVKSRTCLSWAAAPGLVGGCTRMRVTFKIEWTKSSWIKGAVEKGTVEGNKQTYDKLKSEIQKWIQTHPQLIVKAPQPKKTQHQHHKKQGVVSPRSTNIRHRSHKDRDASPVGLRLEQVIRGDKKEQQPRRRKVSNRGHSFIADDPTVESPKELVEAGRRAAENQAEEEAEQKSLLESTQSWKGWLRYHLIRPITHLGLKYTTKSRNTNTADQQTPTASAAPPSSPPPLYTLVTVFTLITLLAITNVWRFDLYTNGGSSIQTPAINSASGVQKIEIEGLREMQSVMEELVQKLDLVNKQLSSLNNKQPKV
ncbi:hypothetical protein H4219_003980 [Mycoemilia scoparia]|uniref:VASt domain-containing protein n=1 Tax=Mycoemilia scoparia TaxID=417184 RepID=A0A9W8DS55_9FUNG|nr:hypothetical protein H4219_003980 [Mycoemilia scoparia]